MFLNSRFMFSLLLILPKDTVSAFFYLPIYQFSHFLLSLLFYSVIKIEIHLFSDRIFGYLGFIIDHFPSCFPSLSPAL